jgi:NodT family efflux transporter outer membrane factor (OMF) lipoprotein
MKNKYLSCIVLLSVFLFACKTNQINTSEINKSIPQQYPLKADTGASNLPPWQKVFADQSLIALIDTALRKNFEVRKALQKIEMAKAGVRFNKGIRLPELEAALNFGQRKFGDYTMDGVGNYDTQFSPNLNEKQRIPDPLPEYYAGLQASWEIDLWGKLKNRKKGAAAKFLANKYGKDLIVTDLIAEIASKYFELLALDNTINILTENIALQQDALDIVLIQKQTGKANELAVELMRAQLLNSKTILTEVKQQHITCESHLNYLCGGYPSNIKRDTSAFLSNNMMYKIGAGIPSALLSNRPDIKQAEMELVSSNANVNAAKAAFYPSLNINAMIGLQSFNAMLLLEAPASLAYQTMGGLVAPLLNRRRLKAELMLANAEKQEAYINYEKTVVNSFTEVYNAIHAINNLQSMYASKQEEVDVLKQSISTSTELFKAGRANYMELIMAQKNALLSQIELVQYNKQQHIAMVNLYRALGGGWK